MKKFLFVALALSIVLVGMSYGTTTIYVDKNNTTGPWDGTAANPYNSIQDGIDVAIAGDAVSVAAGTYNADIVLKSGVVVQGAGAYITTIQGTGSGPVVWAVGVTSVGSFNAVIDGFTITGGYYTHPVNGYGGGIHCDTSSLIISNNIISANTATWGGGISCWATIGGPGGVLLSPTIINNNISGNTSIKNGAGIYLRDSYPLISDNIILGNNANKGGGITLSACNRAGYTTEITNNTMSLNVAADFAGGMQISSSHPNIVNNTISGNNAPNYAGGIYSYGSFSPTITNCIIWDNGVDFYGWIVTFSCLGTIGGGSAGAGTIIGDPKFADVDFHLRHDSPCIDKGNDTAVPSWLLADYEGDDRIYDVIGQGNEGTNVVDMGADEHFPTENTAPVANDQNIVTDEDTAVDITLTATDVDSIGLTYSVESGPIHGILTGTAPDLTYTPDPDYYGPDSFTFKASDGEADSNIATVSITINSVNDAPFADDLSIATDEDNVRIFTITGSDIENDPLDFNIISDPSSGTLSGTAPALTYTPDPDYYGPDSFTFQTYDGELDSNIATVTITVAGINDVPEADDQAATTDEDTPVDITLTGSDIDEDTLSFSIVSGPEHGDLSGTAPDLTYTPDENYNGPDSFTFQVNDGTADSEEAVVSITIDPVNDEPTADDQSVTTDEDTPVSVELTGSDVDPEDTLTFSIVSGPSNGSLSGTAPDLTYTPDENYHGPDSFTFKANDGTVDSEEATVSITVDPVNDAPVADDQSVTTNEDTAVDITLTGSDIEESPLTFSVVNGPSNGALSGTAPDLTYTPNTNFNGSDSFTFKANDGNLDSDAATVNITVNPVNDAPVADDQSVSTDEDTAEDITLTGTDIESDPLTYSVVTGPAQGTLSGSAPDLTYTPNENYNGDDSFTFKVNDGALDSEIATVNITINPVNDLPVADAGPPQVALADDKCQASVQLDGTGSSDIDGDPLTYTWTGPFGTATGPTPTVTLDLGTHEITLTVNDGQGGTASATVEVSVEDQTPPAISLSDPICVSTGKGKGFKANKLTVSAEDNCNGGVDLKIKKVEVFNRGGRRIRGRVYFVTGTDIYVFPMGNGWSVRVTASATDPSDNTKTEQISKSLAKCNKWNFFSLMRYIMYMLHHCFG